MYILSQVLVSKFFFFWTFDGSPAVINTFDKL